MPPTPALHGRRVGLVLGTSTGGIGRHVQLLAAGLAARGAAVTVCGPASTEESFGFTAAGAAFAPVEVGKGVRFADARVVRRLRAALADVDVVHAHGLRPSVAAAAARPAGRPLVVTWHNAVLGSALRRRSLAAAERSVARRAEVVFGASADLVERARALGARDARLGLLPAPALGTPLRSREAVRTELGVGDEALVLTVARLVPQKRLDLLVAAAAELHGQGYRLRVAVAGAGRLGPELARQIRDRQAPVTLLGPRDDVADLLAAADVFALSSEWEARAFVVQEAMLAGCPVVVPAVGGLPDLVDDCGVVVPGGDASALAAGIRQLLDDPQRARELAVAARGLAASWPSEEQVVDAVAAAYLELLA